MSTPSFSCVRFFILAGAMAFALPSHADWAQSTVLDAVQPAPAAFSVPAQNPPSFTWSRHPNATNNTVYTLEVRRGTATPVTFTTARNWYLPTTRFEDGTYYWRVRASGQTEWSTERSFVINQTSQVFEVPDDATLRARATARARPRLLPTSFIPYSQWTTAAISERGGSVIELKAEVLAQTTALEEVADALWPLNSSSTNTVAFAAQGAQIRARLARTTRQLEAATLLYGLTPEQRLLDEAIRRGDELAALSPVGPTGSSVEPLASRAITVALARAYDLLYIHLNTARRERWLDIVALRGGSMYNDVAGDNGRLDQMPFDSRGDSLGPLALVAALTVDAVPEARTWFDYSVRAYIHSIAALGGPEGGYSQGTAYAEMAAGAYVKIWDPLKELTGVNLYNKPWSTGFTRFLAQFTPPGQPLHVFGDGHEVGPNKTTLRSFAGRVATPESRWFYNQLTGREDALTLLAAPFPMPVTQATAAAPANAGVYQGGGFAAMHSNIAAATRTSLYFKSSPFGAYRHSHADQNSIVLFSNNKPLLSETGYYDYFGSPLSSSWYRETKAHNAITFDGGIGQPSTGYAENLGRKGAITAFSTTAAIDYVEGDATKAYGGALTNATRRIWYLRSQNQILIHDKLASATPRKYEWNFHAPVAITKNADNTVTIINGTEKLCIRPLFAGATFETRTGATPQAGTVEYHAAYTSASANFSEFFMLLDVGCLRPPVSMQMTTTGRIVTVGTQTFTMPK